MRSRSEKSGQRESAAAASIVVVFSRSVSRRAAGATQGADREIPNADSGRSKLPWPLFVRRGPADLDGHQCRARLPAIVFAVHSHMPLVRETTRQTRCARDRLLF